MNANLLRRVNWLWKHRHTHDDDTLQEQITVIKTTVETNADSEPVGFHEHNVHAERVTTTAPLASYVTDQQGFYDVASKRTYIAYLGLERDLHVTYWDHQSGSLVSPVEVGAYPLDDDDNHGAPSICVDLEGFIHVVWGSHSLSSNVTPHKYSKSDNPYDISAWTTTDLDSDDGTYPQISLNPATGDLYVIDRVGDSPSGSFPDNKRYAGMRKSADNGTTWSAVSQIIDCGADFIYPFGAVFGPDGYLHVAWTFDPDAGGIGGRTYVHHAKYDPSTDTWFSADGTSLGSDISSTEQADECRLDAIETEVGTTAIAVAASGNIAVLYTANDRAVVSVWDGSSWDKTVLSDSLATTIANYGTVWPVEDGWRALIPVDTGTFEDLVLYGSWEDGDAWAEIGTILQGNSGEGFAHASAVRGNGPIVALAMQSHSGFADTSATASDLLPLFAVFDEDYELGHGGTGDSGDHEHDQYAGELLMQDGITAPPVPLETEARDDWLYEG